MTKIDQPFHTIMISWPANLDIETNDETNNLFNANLFIN